MNFVQAFLDGLAVLDEKWTAVAGIVILVCGGCGVLLLLDQKTSPWRGFLIPGSFFAMSLILRLAFLKDLFVPPYFDSVEHYRIITNLMTALETDRFLETLPTLTPTYYHLGFHVLASLLALGLRADPMDVILVLGQVILAAIPLPVYLLVRRETNSARSAFFAMLLAGFGWYMPGFAVNWGKYPALAGLLALEIVLGSAYVLTWGKKKGSSPALGMLLLLTTIIATLFHTRVLIVIAISIVSWIIAGKTQATRRLVQGLSLGFLLGMFLVFNLFSQTELQLKLALEPYLGLGVWVTLIVIALCPFALLHFPRGFYFSLLLMAGMLLALFTPAGLRSPGLENQTLLDRPFVEMALYLPLSLLGGLGLAGLLRSLNGIRFMPDKKYVRVSTTILLLVLTVVLMENYDFSPSECCNFVHYDDTIALDWLDKNLPADAHILVAGTTLNVLPTGPSPGLVGTDAGIWIPNLTGRDIRLVAFETDFGAENTLRELCQIQIDYIYVGSTAQKFDSAQLGEKLEWYQEILFLPNAQLYRLRGCTK